jgi:hypothetical protein
MKRSWMTWLGAGLVVPALALGCRQSRQYEGGGDTYTPPMIGAKAPRNGPAPEMMAMQVAHPQDAQVVAQK